MPAIRWRKVVLPKPLSPLNATCAFSVSENSGTSITTCVEPSGARKDFLSPEISSSGMGGVIVEEP